MKYLVAVVSCAQEPYYSLENEGVRKTWASIPHKDVSVIYYYGSRNKSEIRGDSFFMDCTEGHMEVKAMLFFERILEEYKDLEYVFFTNLSSYVRLDKIADKFKCINNDNYYSGVVGDYYGTHFASGAGLFISRKLLTFLVENKSKLNTSIAGDVAYGELLINSGVKLVPQDRLDILSLEHLSTIKKEDVEPHYHFRCKQKNRSDDIVVMKRIHTLLGY